jgi:D-alanyl-lipoteichoic acid acyltransferase DltB (MBOAT superfamily)
VDAEMLFNTPIYFVFLTSVVVVYWRLSHREQNLLLLACSYFFYGWWDWRFLFLMATSTLADYWLALRIAGAADGTKRRAYLLLSLLMNFGFLGVFKYFNFFVDSFNHVEGLFGAPERLGPFLHVILPAGISFYTFQAVAYIVDVYFGKLRPTRGLVEYGLFISFFPHLVAGPIQRPSHLLPQVQLPRQFDARTCFDGLALIVTGLFRKCVIGDNCALLANAVFGGQLGKPNFFLLLLGAYAFAWQIYGDFSGYSDIARGSAQLLGFHFMVNFRQPYLATGLADFWHRWHISLSTWLRDYLYIPLGGNRAREARTYRNIFVTMLLGGLWHGANWTFIVWGGLHGLALTASKWFVARFRFVVSGLKAEMRPETSLRLWLKRVLVFQFVCLAWIFFRAPTVHEALHMLRGITNIEWNPLYGTAARFLVLFSLPLMLLDLRLERFEEEYPFQRCLGHLTRTSYAAKAAFSAILLGVVLLAAAPGSNAFIYFQF